MVKGKGAEGLKFSGTTTESTAGLGPGMGVITWAPPHRLKLLENLRPKTTSDAQNDGDSEELSPLEVLFHKYRLGRPPKRLLALEKEWRERYRKWRMRRKRRKPKKGRQSPRGAQQAQPRKVPTTVRGMIWARSVEEVLNFWGRINSQIEFWRRQRQIDGPGPVEQIFRELVLDPLMDMLHVSFLHIQAFWQVNDGFVLQRIRALKEKGLWEDDEEADNSEGFLTWRQLETQQQRVQTVVALLSTLSICIAIGVNELQFRGYIPAWTEDCANPNSDPRRCFENPSCTYFEDPASGRMLLACDPIATYLDRVKSLKYLNSVVTALLIFSIYIWYRYEANIQYVNLTPIAPRISPQMTTNRSQITEESH